MKIMVIVDDYPPHSTKITAKMMHELVLQFIKEGNEVTVLTPKGSSKGISMGPIENLKIYRFKSGKIKNISKVRRAMNETLFSVKIYFQFFKKLKNDRHDLIVYYSPSIFFGPIVLLLKKCWECPSYLILRDLFPQWAIDQKLLNPNSLVTKYFKFFEKVNYRAADYIALQSPSNLNWFNKNFAVNKKLHVLFNWTSDLIDAQKKTDKHYKSILKIENKIVFFYGGNMGKAQDMSNLLRLANSLKGEFNAHFVFVGNGDEVPLVKNFIAKNELHNVTLLDPVDQVEYNKMLVEFDVGLISLHKAHQTHNFPGKILGYMANRLPILGSINPENDLKELINNSNAGFITLNSRDEEFVLNALQLLRDENLRRDMGDNAKTLLKNKFSVKNAADKILSIQY